MKCLLNYDINYKNPILLGPVYKPYPVDKESVIFHIFQFLIRRA